MKPDKKYTLHLVDGDIIKGTFVKEERGFFLLKSSDTNRVVRKASVKRVEEWID